MKRWLGLGMLVFTGAAGWRIGGALSPDALSMATGVLFGVMAGVPTALLVMAGSRRSAAREDERHTAGHVRQQGQLLGPTYGQGYGQRYGRGSGCAMPYAQQPPIIVVTGPQGMSGSQGMTGGQPNIQAHNYSHSQSSGGWFSQEAPTRYFTVVGEHDTLVEEW